MGTPGGTGGQNPRENQLISKKIHLNIRFFTEYFFSYPEIGAGFRASTVWVSSWDPIESSELRPKTNDHFIPGQPRQVGKKQNKRAEKKKTRFISGVVVFWDGGGWDFVPKNAEILGY